MGDDGFPYMTLSYANGMGYKDHVKSTGGRVDPRTLDSTKLNFKAPATVHLTLETHGGEDVPIYARGPYAHLFRSTMEQNVIPHIMAFASCIGEGLTSCV